MKRLVGIIAFSLIIYVIYHDLTYGTLPIALETNTEAKAKNMDDKQGGKKTQILYFKTNVESGDTVLSIVERKINGSLPVSIKEMIEDFQSLNNGLEPEKIQYGKTYKFPDYRDLVE